MPVRNYRDLIVWQKAMDVCQMAYELSRKLPADERFGLVLQMRRAAVSIPSNIAEGHARSSDKELCRFLAIAHGSLREVETQWLIAVRLGMLNNEVVEKALMLSAEVGRLIQGLRKAAGS